MSKWLPDMMSRDVIVLLMFLATGSSDALAADPRPVVVHIDAQATGPAIPDDFCGLSFESSNLLPDKQGKHLFSAEDADLIALFRTIGIRNLRIGGGTADLPQYGIPGPADIDHLFAFAQAADVKIIYTLRLLNGSAQQDAEIARYIQQRYASRLVCFEIGNEPDWHSYHTSPGHPRDPKIVETIAGNPGTAFPSFLADWNEFASAITRAASGAKFTGPDTGSNHPVPGTPDTDFNGESWTVNFARAEKDSGRLLFLTQHDYAGQGAGGVNVSTALASMLSEEWVNQRYQPLFDHVLGPVQKEGLSYRMTEANDYTGGVNGASNAYASALWALDYLHWHAAHHALGVNFHNKRWIFTDTILPDASGKLYFNPKAYAIKAFDIGGHGIPMPLTITNTDGTNLTAYAVRKDQSLFVTLINKEFGPTAKEAAVTIQAQGIARRSVGMMLQAPANDVTTKAGITLGGASMTTNSWNGQWTDLNLCTDSQTDLRVPPASAIVVKLDLK